MEDQRVQRATGQPPEYDFSKIKESSRFGRHIRLETGKDGKEIVKIDSTFEKNLRNVRAAVRAAITGEEMYRIQ